MDLYGFSTKTGSLREKPSDFPSAELGFFCFFFFFFFFWLLLLLLFRFFICVEMETRARSTEGPNMSESKYLSLRSRKTVHRKK